MSAEDYFDDRDPFDYEDEDGYYPSIRGSNYTPRASNYRSPQRIYDTIGVHAIIRQTTKAYQLQLFGLTFYYPKKGIESINYKAKEITLDIGLLEWIIKHQFDKINTYIESGGVD